jgi:hypothetical protein
MTAMQFDQLNEFYNLYHELGGNSSADNYYQKVKVLSVHEEDEE